VSSLTGGEEEEEEEDADEEDAEEEKKTPLDSKWVLWRDFPELEEPEGWRNSPVGLNVGLPPGESA
jgi:hypothetical protein